MKKPVIIDSSAFISLGTITDSNFEKANTISKQIEKDDRTIVMPSEVFTEIINVVGKKVGHDAAIKQGSKILSSGTITIVETTPDIRRNAFFKFQKQPKSVSFTDCLVMAFADEFETKEIFGFDEAFRKNEYTRVGIDRAQAVS